MTLSERDYTLIIDRSGSMSQKDQVGGRTRWAAARESTQALAAKCDALDADGLTLYVFGSRFRRYDGVGAERVSQVFEENEPCGGTDLAGVLQHAFESYFARKAKGTARPETILVVTDGEPDDRRAVIRTIIDASRRIDRDEELGSRSSRWERIRMRAASSSCSMTSSSPPAPRSTSATPSPSTRRRASA